MRADDAVVAMLDALRSADVPYMLVGSLASNFYGVPRATRDADFVIELRERALERVAAALPPALQLRPQASFEAVTGTPRHLVELADSPFVCELFVLSDDPHDVSRFSRRQRVQMLERTVFIASAEDMIITKLRWAREAGRLKDRDDARNIIAVQGSRLDWSCIEHWVGQHGTAATLEEIRASLPPGPTRPT